MRPRRRKVDLKKTLFILPNLITLSSVFCGFNSIRLAGKATGDDDGDFYRASIMLVFALIFDMLDGRVARMTKTQSAFGLQIDSLADVVSFGVAPALLIYRWSLYQAGDFGIVVAFIFCGAGAVRLARFNVLSMGESGQPTKPSKFILGLPVPGAAGVLISVIIANHAHLIATGGAAKSLAAPAYLGAFIFITLVLSFFMVSTIKFRSFKELKLNAGTIALVVFIIASSIAISVHWSPAFVLVWLLGFYVAIGLIETVFRIFRPAREKRASLPPGS